jgi:DNA-directed RNA polymerase subunit RPC12/RpoP
MPKMAGYRCRACGGRYEFLHHPVNEPAVCPACGSSDAEPELKACVLSTIVPTYPGSKRHKAGFCHLFQNRQAEKTSISVPRTLGGM